MREHVAWALRLQTLSYMFSHWSRPNPTSSQGGWVIDSHLHKMLLITPVVLGLLGRVAIGAPNISKFSKTGGISHPAASDCQKVEDFGWNWDRLLLQSIFWTNTFMWKRMSRGCKWIFSQCHLPYCKQIEFVHNKSDLIRCRLFWREQFCQIENIAVVEQLDRQWSADNWNNWSTDSLGNPCSNIGIRVKQQKISDQY